MIPFVHGISPGASVLAIRGSVVCGAGFAHFSRDETRLPDLADLHRRTEELQQFIDTFAEKHLADRALISCGFSNGAVMAASLLLYGGLAFSAALLFRPMVPFTTAGGQAQTDLPVLLVDASDDERRDPQDAVDLAGLFRQCGAAVCHRTVLSGHAPNESDFKVAAGWLRSGMQPSG